MNRRTAILEFIADKLRANPNFGEILLGQRRALDPDTLPCTELTIADETSEVASRGDILELKKSATLTIQYIITDLSEEADTLEMVLHQLSADGEALILSDDSLGDQVSRIAPISLKVETDYSGESPIGVATNRYLVEYYEQIVAKADAPLMTRVSVAVGVK